MNGSYLYKLNAFTERTGRSAGTAQKGNTRPRPPDSRTRDFLHRGHQISSTTPLTQGNLLKGFENYISIKTSKIQSGQKKLKVENYERMFSLSSTTSKTSQILEESLTADPLCRIDIQASAPKRNRPRQGGKTKSGGKNLLREENEDEESSDSGEGDIIDESIEDSMGKNRGSKKKKINKLPPRKG